MLRAALLAIFFLAFVTLLSLSGSRVSSQNAPVQPPQANNENKRVARMVEDAKRSGRDFPATEPFERQTRSVAADTARRRAVTAGTILQLRRGALADLVNGNEAGLTLRLPTFGGPPVELELVQVSLFAPGFKVVTNESEGEPVAYQHGVHYWGVIKGETDSLATISVFKDEVIGSFSSSRRGNFVIGKLGGNNPQRDHIVYAEKDLTMTIPVECEMPDDDTAFSQEQLSASSTAQVVRCVKIFLETDFDLFQNKGSVQATVDYVTGVFNQSAALYSNEGIPISISEIFVWTSPSPYTGSSSQQQLAQFQNFRTSFNGDFAHLVDLQNQGGIAAGFNGFCNPNRWQSQCYSGIFPFFSDVPTYSWTVYVFTHEMGHLMGSRHTHACVWNGNGTAIDGCGQQAGFFEGGCGFGPIPPGGGTVMSYCHLNSVGVNFSFGFGPQPGNVIRNGFNNAGCLGNCGEPENNTYTTAFQSSGGYFVVAEGGGGSVVNANRVALGPWETFTLYDLNGGALESGDLVNIQSISGHFVVAENGGGDVVNCNRTIPHAWETFRIEKVFGSGVIGSGETISLQAFHGWNGAGGNYVVAEFGGGDVVNANRAAIGSWEMFTIHIF